MLIVVALHHVPIFIMILNYVKMIQQSKLIVSCVYYIGYHHPQC